MNELTLESLNKRIEVLEAMIGLQSSNPNLSVIRPTSGKDWRSVIGTSLDPEFQQQVDAAGRKIREAEREAARRGEEE